MQYGKPAENSKGDLDSVKSTESTSRVNDTNTFTSHAKEVIFEDWTDADDDLLVLNNKDFNSHIPLNLPALNSMTSNINLKLKGIQCDNSTKFKNSTLNYFWAEKGVLRQCSSTRTLQQNGVAERRNITLIEVARTMLFVYTDFSGAAGSNYVDEEEELHADSHISTVLGIDPSESLDTTQPFSVNQQEEVTETVSSPTPTVNASSVEGERPIRQIFGSTLFPDVIANEYIVIFSYSHSQVTSGWKKPLTEILEDLSNLPSTSSVPGHSIPSRIQRDHPIDNVIGPIETGASTRSQTEHINSFLFSCFISHIEPKSVEMALLVPIWENSKHEELNQFDKLKVWRLVELPVGKKALDARWVFHNKQDDTGVIVRNKARLVVSGFRQVEGLDYTEVYAIVARLESIRIFLAYASYMGFIVYQMDIKTVFLYGEIKEEIYVDQPPGFVESKNQTHVYKSDKALYGLHQAPRGWYATLTAHLLGHGYKRGTIDQTLYLKGQPKLGLWNPKNSDFHLYAFADNNYGGDDIDSKSTSAGCLLLGDRPISW
ncbi:uncharacterized protein LOC143592748 [Bidens hawaiensis]|uniref:uncharacterized protein LOC143592748 n=1 Tax=Bidens hawaiensis TaxID=980011 RepID=UPI004049E2B6